MFSREADRVLGFAQRAEGLGFDGVFAFDHLMPLGGPVDGPAFECFASLAAVAAATERVALGTLVARASLRPAGLLAKLAASVHAMSGGRLILTVGTGDELSKREHDAFGLPYFGSHDRRSHLEQTVAAVRALFAGERWPGGDHVPRIDGPLLPAVADAPPRVWIGGTSEAAVRSASALAEGWNGWGLSLETFAERARLLRELGTGEATWGGVALVGRDGAELDHLLERRAAADKAPPPGSWTVDAEGLAANLRRLRDAGASWVMLLPAGPADRLEVIAEAARAALDDA